LAAIDSSGSHGTPVTSETFVDTPSPLQQLLDLTCRTCREHQPNHTLRVGPISICPIHSAFVASQIRYGLCSVCPVDHPPRVQRLKPNHRAVAPIITGIPRDQLLTITFRMSRPSFSHPEQSLHLPRVHKSAT
jgi:hypothetical protein